MEIISVIEVMKGRNWSLHWRDFFPFYFYRYRRRNRGPKCKLRSIQRASAFPNLKLMGFRFL